MKIYYRGGIGKVFFEILKKERIKIEIFLSIEYLSTEVNY